MTKAQKEDFLNYCNNLIIQAEIEAETSEFTKAISNVVMSDTIPFNPEAQAFLLIAVDDIDTHNPRIYKSFNGDAKGYEILLEAMKGSTQDIMDEIRNETYNNGKEE